MKTGIKFLRQPTKNTCGQTCVAILTGQTVDSICRLIGKNGGTCGPDLIRALRSYGLETSDRSLRSKSWLGDRPDVAIVRIHAKGFKGSHWVVWANGKFYDPARGVFGSLQDGAYATSFIRVFK